MPSLEATLLHVVLDFYHQDAIATTLSEWRVHVPVAATIAAAVFVGISTWTLLCTGLRPWWSQRKTPHESIPMLPDSHWLFGHLFWVLRRGYLDKQQELADHADARGRCSIWLGCTPSISLTTPSDAKRLLRNVHTRAAVPVLRYHLDRLTGPRNLFFMNGREWKYYHSALRTAMSRLDPHFVQSITQEATGQLTRNLKERIATEGDGTSVDVPSIQELMKMITIDVFGRSAFSHDFGCCAEVELCAFVKAFEFMEADIISRCTKHTLLPQNLFYLFPTARNSKFHQHRTMARSELRQILRKRKSNHREDARAKDIVGEILRAHAKGTATAAGSSERDDALSEEDMIDFLFSLLLAGYETISTALTYSLYLLSRNPEWEKWCLEEVRELTKQDAKSNQELKLPACRGAVMEALRLYPVATGTSRNLENPLVFQDGVTLSRGSQAGVSFWQIHRCEKYFPKALDFRPDRWMPSHSSENSVGKSRPCAKSRQILPGDLGAFFAFSAGARSCPGQNYALREATVALAWLLKDLEFTIDPTYELEIEWKAVVQGPRGGIPANISIRKT